MASASCQVYDSIISQFQVLVSEFAEELLVAERYYEDDPDFWVGSGLIKDADSQQAVFNACRRTTSNFKGVSSSDAAKQLFEVHIDILQGLGFFLGSTGYDGSFSEAHGWCHLYALSKAVSQSRATSPEIVVKQEKKVVIKQEKSDKKGKGKEWAV